ncbi:NAD(P)-dependent alcohol dehydrogenase [Salinibacterium sp. PAMC 21357]|uniref:NAD(P)-dependent alcohol dehydrogenase n=1 Tax=Salinibacterium sp. PAMC 21357 TaxID=1112215 RepID=UPI000289C39A|nr:NAD(P)-dependent alcohol dehydrogenase [Salinibacterium sp. PAMC 21357]
MSVSPPESPATGSGRNGGSVPARMTAVTARAYGNVDVLAIESLPTPDVTPGKLLVRVMASSANALDWRLLSGTPLMVRLIMGLRTPKRLIPGADVAGIVEAVGAGVSGFAVGDAIFGESAGGAFADYVVIDAAIVALLPAGVDFVAAGATPVAGLTALQALRTHAAIKVGDRVLINGAAGGVGTFAIQIARALGAGEITAVCSAENAEQSRRLGATRVIDYRGEDFIAAGGQYDVALDIRGNRTAAQIRSILAPGARYVAVSGPMTNRLLGPLPHLLRMKLGLARADASFHQFTAAATPEDLAYLAALLVSGELVPAIDRVVGLEDAAGAIAQIASGHGAGKVAVVPGDRPQQPPDAAA